MSSSKRWEPRAEGEAILDRAFEYVQSVQYAVSTRWLFYQLFQDGTYPDKDGGYKQLKSLTAKARHASYKEWRPDTLEDDTRQPVIRGDGWWDELNWLDAVGRMKCKLDKWVLQDNYVELWFEARGMRGQFEYYTKHITLRPFGGDPSIAYKWQIAKDLEAAAELYEKPIVIVYFGDLDPKGLSIPKNAVNHIRQWCSTDFEIIRGGLNPGDEVTYNIPENPDKPGTFQWEALNDAAAGELITRTIAPFISHGYFSEVEEQEAEITARFQVAIQELGM